MIDANGTLTIESPKGGHRTFRITTSKALGGKRVVALLTGSDNENDYTGFAFATDDGVKVWRRFLSTPNEKPTKWEYFGAMLDRLVGGIENPLTLDGYTVKHERKCRRCNRKLTTPESIEAGIGPECIKKE